MERLAAPSSSVYSSTCTTTDVESEIEASKDHWSELQRTSGGVPIGQQNERVHMQNAEIVEESLEAVSRLVITPRTSVVI